MFLKQKLLGKLNSTGWKTVVSLTKFKEVSRQNIFIQIVVRQIQNLKNREGAKAAKIKLIEWNYSMSREAAVCDFFTVAVSWDD